MKAYQHILLTTDYSKFSEEVAKKAINLAGHFNAKITLLHVVETESDRVTVDNVMPADVSFHENLITYNKTRLQEFIHTVPNLRAIPMISRADGNIEDAIIRVAKQIKANLIIIGAQGEEGVSVLPGLNTDSIKEKAPCDVLVVQEEPDHA